ncbi:MAG TPA: GNAT family N-acetyltransferase [Clostridiales bacterium]|nr:GNAT family N-acetyltransferase [Clostridiales bacterium]
MSYSLLIKKAEISDAQAIHAIINEAFNKYIKDAGICGRMEALEETPEDIIQDMNTKEVFIALADNIPVGTIRVEIKADNTAFISRFGVLPQYQKNGIGRSLITFLDNFLVSKGVNKVYLYTASRHRDLVRFYYGMGFYIDSTTKDKGYIRAMMVKEY